MKNHFCRLGLAFLPLFFTAPLAQAFDPSFLRLVNSVGYYISAVNDTGTLVVGNIPYALTYDGSTVNRLGTLGGKFSYAYGVNDWGVTVGESQISYGPYRAFAYFHGSMTDLGTLGGDYSAAFNINNANTIVGESLTSDGHYHAFSFSNGKMTDLGTLPFNQNSAAYGINSSGTIVGTSDYWAFSYSNGVMTALDGSAIYSLQCGAEAINDSGTIVGWSQSAIGLNFHAMSYSNGVMTDLGDLGTGQDAGLCESYATAISNDGTIVGFSTTSTEANPEIHAFLYKGGVMIDLDADPADSSQAFAVDDNGNVFGGSGWGYLLNPAK